MSLARQLGNVPTRDNALETVTLGDAEHVDHLVLGEDGLCGNLLLKELVAEVNLVRNRATVHLDLDNVRFLLSNLHLGHLGVRDYANDLTMLLDFGKFLVRVLGTIRFLLSVLCEGLLVLGLVPVLVQPSAELVRQVLGPHSCKRTETARSLHITNNAYHHNRRCLNDGNSLNGLLLVLL